MLLLLILAAGIYFTGSTRFFQLTHLGLLYAFLCVLVSFGMGNMAQANSIAQALEGTWHLSPLVTAPFLALLVWHFCRGGGKRVGRSTRAYVKRRCGR